MPTYIKHSTECFLLCLVLEETESTIQEVHDCTDSYKGNDIRQECLKETQATTNDQEQK